MAAIGQAAATARASQCSVPREGGWRPGARWAQADAAAPAGSRGAVRAAVAALPAHQRPPQRELGRVSQAAAHPFAGAGEGVRELSRRTEAAAHPFKPGARTGVAAGTHTGERRRRPSARDGVAGEAGFIAPPSLARLAALPPVQGPGEGPHPDRHGRDAAGTPGEGRFFQTGRTLGPAVARACAVAEPAAAPATDDPPLVMVAQVRGQAVVTAANPAARAAGLQPGMALASARAQVPTLATRPADPAGDAAALVRLAERLARRWAPTVAVSGADGLFVDLAGVAHLHGGEERFGRRLLRLLARHGIVARVAVADSAGAAWALARYTAAPVQIVPPGAHAAALAALPVAALRLGDDARDLLARLGVDRVGALARLPRAPLVRRFGVEVAKRLDQALGRLPEPLAPVHPPTRIAVRQAFLEPIATAEAIAHWLGVLLPRLAVALASAGQGARLVELVAARVDGVPQRLRLGFARATRCPVHMARLALARVAEIAPGFGIDALTLVVRRAEPLGAVPLAPALATDSPPDLAPLVDAIGNRIGAARLWRLAAVASDVPERSVGQVAPLDPPPVDARPYAIDDVRQLDARAPDHPWHPRWPRPARLLKRPEEVAHVVAELPDQAPRRFTWRGTRHEVVGSEGPERIAGEWWRRSAKRLAVRDYFRVEVAGGERFWLFRRGDGVRAETGDLRWFLHGRCG